MNFVMPQFLGEFDEFNEIVVKPIKKAFVESESSSTLSLKALNSANEIQLEKSAQISAEGLSILRSLHKQVYSFIVILLLLLLLLLLPLFS